MTSAIGDCYSCGYPIAATKEGERISCPYCLSINEVIAIEPPSMSALAIGILGSLVVGALLWQMAKGRISL